MDIKNIILGFLLLFGAVVWLILLIRSNLKDKNYNPRLTSYDISIVFGLIVSIVYSLTLIYKGFNI